MEDRLTAYHKHRERMQEYKETAAKGCYSLIMVMAALILLRPMMVDQMLGRADAYSGVGLLDESERQCDKALLIDGDNSRAWRRLARIHKLRGNRDAACGAYQKAVQTDPSDRLAQFELGLMYVEDGRHQLAIPCFEQVRRLGRETPAGSPAAEFSCHRGSLDMLIRCYEKEGDAAKLEMALKEMRIFYPTAAVPSSRQSN
jgi:tetratricopeptide (TPR) repeat protein